MANYSGSDSEDSSLSRPEGFLVKRKRAVLLSSSDEDAENVSWKRSVSKMGKIFDSHDSDSGKSTKTEIIDTATAENGDELPGVLSENEQNSELLSLASDSNGGTFDSDETFFEETLNLPPRSESKKTNIVQSPPGIPKSSTLSSSDETFFEPSPDKPLGAGPSNRSKATYPNAAAGKKATRLPLKNLSADTDDDDFYAPWFGGGGTNRSQDQGVKGEKSFAKQREQESKGPLLEESKTPQLDEIKSPPLEKSISEDSLSAASDYDSHFDSSDDDFIQMRQRRRQRQRQKYVHRKPSHVKFESWIDADNSQWDNESPDQFQYDPTSVTKETWHGDVQRTVKMLDETLEKMPMPNENGDEDANLNPPPGLVELYPHQKYALKWMSWRERQFPGGGILADEMGLGKTIEVIGLIMKSKWNADLGKENLVTTEEAGKCIPSRTTLVICPLGCILQWKREIETKAKSLSVYTYHGPKKTDSAVELAKFDVVITTYHTVGFDIPTRVPNVPVKRCRSPLKHLYWLRIVLDEAHIIRNPKTKAADAIYQLEARHRWCVTGTPIHNRPEDFYSMCTFLRLTPFDDRKVWDFWIGLKVVKIGAQAEKRLHVLGKALILRRTKEEVGMSGTGEMKVIPPKTVEIIPVELNEQERLVYDSLMEYAQSILKEFLSQKEKREHGVYLGGLIYAADLIQKRREDFPNDIQFSHIFALLIRLRQCAVLPHLILTMLADEEFHDSDDEFNELKPEHIVSKRNPVFSSNYISSKFQKILEDVDELRQKVEGTNKPMDKVIIVSCWTSTLDLIHQHLLAKGYSCVFITGREDMNTRMGNMDRFNKNKWRPQVLLLSLMAGGVGLNLIGANHVFFIEPHWNPQHELQAQDRVHRFGQTKDVTIRRYITENTIEHRIMDLQQQKLELADGLLKNTRKLRGAGVTLEQMKKLFEI